MINLELRGKPSLYISRSTSRLSTRLRLNIHCILEVVVGHILLGCIQCTEVIFLILTIFILKHILLHAFTVNFKLHPCLHFLHSTASKYYF
jgi:hypothetical protein